MIFKLMTQILRKTWYLIFPAGVVFCLIDQFLVKLIMDELSNLDGPSPFIWLLVVLSMALSMFGSILQISLVLFGLSQLESAGSFLKKHLEQLIIEQLRATGKVIQWSFLFLIPGLLKVFQYCLVPFVVVFDRNYEQGEVDALKKSSILFRQHWFKFVLIGALFSFIFPLVFLGLDEYSVLIDHPISGALINFGETVIMALGLAVFYQQLKPQNLSAS